MTIRPTILATAAALLLGAATLTAQAQSAYTVSVLGKPSGAEGNQYLPAHLDNKDVVRGGYGYVSGIGFGIPGVTNCLICTKITSRTATWPAGTSSAISAQAGERYLFPLVGNDQGTVAGVYNKSGQSGWAWLPTAFSPLFSKYHLISGQTAALQGGTFTFAAGSDVASTSFKPAAMNNSGWLAGKATVNTDGTPRTAAAVWKSGVVTALAPADIYFSEALAINDAGTIAGRVARLGPTGAIAQTRPAVWVNGQLHWEGDASLENYHAVAINTPGQVLLRGATGSALWFNGVLTPITSPTGLPVQASALNDAGTVVGCELNDPARITAGRPFIWKNGVMKDLAQEITSKGGKLPGGVVLGCPLAINNKGSLLTAHWNTQDLSSIKWIRVNARP